MEDTQETQEFQHIKIPLTPVASSNIRAVGYDTETQTLRVQFGNGQCYDYPKVPAELHQEFIQAESVGSFFHRNIRTKVTGIRVPVEYLAEQKKEQEDADEPKEV